MTTKDINTLIVHPQDESTAFLKTIYGDSSGFRLITSGVTDDILSEAIRLSTRVIMLGHGVPDGLMSVGQFPGGHFNVIRAAHAELLKDKPDNIYIWCHANEYVEMHHLKGFYTGMFISEMHEAKQYDIEKASKEEIDQSNQLFVRAVSLYKHLPAHDLLTEVVKMYGSIRHQNPVVNYNVNLLGAR